MRGPADGSDKLKSLNLILSEKNSYIRKLELELNDMRLENEKLKDRVIIHELENIGRLNNAP